MAARPFRNRKIMSSIVVDYYKPRGIPLNLLSEVVLRPDEFEAIKLSDFEEMYQADAAEKMGVSRQTFGNIIKSGHKKIAEALIKGKAIRIEGKVEDMSKDNILECNECNYSWRSKELDSQVCPKCGSNDVCVHAYYCPGRKHGVEVRKNSRVKENMKDMEVVMPGKDGTGPLGNVPKGSASRGVGQGGKGRMGGPYSAGPGGSCICPGCGYKKAHIAGQPCSSLECPKCGIKMTREKDILL